MATAPDLLGPSGLHAPPLRPPVFSGEPGKRWFVLQSKPREETVCRDELGRGGIEAFCPLVREFRVRRKRYETVPLFPGYVFARFAYPEQFHEVLWKRGVSRIVQFGEAIPSMDDEVVDFFRRRTNPEGFIEKGPEFKPGDPVELRSGQLKGMVGTILKMDSAHQRVMVLLDLLSRPVRVEVERHRIQAV